MAAKLESLGVVVWGERVKVKPNLEKMISLHLAQLDLSDESSDSDLDDFDESDEDFVENDQIIKGPVVETPNVFSGDLNQNTCLKDQNSPDDNTDITSEHRQTPPLSTETDLDSESVRALNPTVDPSPPGISSSSTSLPCRTLDAATEDVNSGQPEIGANLTANSTTNSITNSNTSFTTSATPSAASEHTDNVSPGYHDNQPPPQTCSLRHQRIFESIVTG